MTAPGTETGLSRHAKPELLDAAAPAASSARVTPISGRVCISFLGKSQFFELALQATMVGSDPLETDLRTSRVQMLPHGLEPWTSRLLAERSNQLSYESR